MKIHSNAANYIAEILLVEQMMGRVLWVTVKS